VQLELSDDQELLRETTARFVERETPLTRVRELIDDPVGFEPGWLRESAGLGWFAMFVPEEQGGGCVSGKPLVDATIIAEELGRAMQPGPFLAMNVVAFALAQAGSAEQRDEVLPALTSGEVVATWALADRDGSWNDGGVEAERDGNGFTLSGTRSFAQDAQSAANKRALWHSGGPPRTRVHHPRAVDGREKKSAMADVDLDEYRKEAACWLVDNVPKRDASFSRGARGGGGEESPEFISEQRALQRSLFEGGYAGITWRPSSEAQASPTRTNECSTKRLPGTRSRSSWASRSR
jgi:Acyl-CoA dehydrogenase, N-terminal domain